MNNIAKCDTWCELQNSVNHRVFERKLRPKPSGRGHVCLSVTNRRPPHPLEDMGRKLISRVLPHASGEASSATDRAQVPWKGAPERVRAPSCPDPVAPRGAVYESGCLGMQPQSGGKRMEPAMRPGRMRNGAIRLPTLETAQPEVESSGWKSTARRVVSGAFPAALENPEDRVPLTPGKGSRQNGSVTLGKGLALRAGLGVPVPNPSTVGGLLELLTWRERTASCRPGDGLGTALSGAFPRRRTANSELCSECQSEEIQPSAGKRRDETTAKGTGLAESPGKEDPVELDSSPTFTNTNRESVAYRSFRPSEFEARGVRKVTTGITGLWEPSVHSDVAF
ncbi:hypothetical protein YC2023_071582 [Brassica napus]